MVAISFSQIAEAFVLVSAKFNYQILLQEIFEVTNISIYHAVTIEKSDKKSTILQFHISTFHIQFCRKMIILQYLRNLHDILRTEKDDLSALKNNKMIFSLEWNTMFTEYGQVLVFNFLEMGNTVFFLSKNLV